MATVVYENLVFPHTVGGPGPWDTLVLTVTASGSGSDSNECLTQADIVAFNAASDADKERHRRFSDIVSYFSQYGRPISIDPVTNNVITMKFERKGAFENSTKATAPWFDKGHRPNAYDLAAAFTTANAGAPYYITGITVTINGSAQSST